MASYEFFFSQIKLIVVYASTFSFESLTIPHTLVMMSLDEKVLPAVCKTVYRTLVQFLEFLELYSTNYAMVWLL